MTLKQHYRIIAMYYIQTEFSKPRSVQSKWAAHQPATVSLKLKPYQLASVGWMTRIERYVIHGKTFWFPCTFSINNCPLTFDLLHKVICIPPASKKSTKGNMNVTVKGGILAGQQDDIVSYYIFWLLLSTLIYFTSQLIALKNLIFQLNLFLI